MSTHTAPALPPEKGGQRGVIFAAIAIMVGLCACTTHTRYYTTDGTRVTEIERTTNIGSPTPAPQTQGEHTGSPMQNAPQTQGEHTGSPLQDIP